ncbi:MAG: hypothetical protein CVU60_03185 [Deltaproteobacteria bacterium HGW-Deltaproteobacteria-18]|jgi:hypothetical protein|nr:MAG: hypothetical protein CVU60_03185 [Deltaproteobacteria bacterium HGW-Deltaproteobacteria-18]
MQTKMKGIVLAMVLFLCAGNVWASVSLTSATFDAGSVYKAQTAYDHRNYEFNLSFSSPVEGVSSTFGYCAELGQTFSADTQYQSAEISGNYLQAAWLIDKYSTYETTDTGFQGTTNRVTISALQAAIWSVLGQSTQSRDYTPLKPNWLDRWWLGWDSVRVYNLYTAMLDDVSSISDFSGLDLESRFQLLTDGLSQDLIVRTSAVPLPGAAILFGSGLLGLVGLRRRKIA